MTGHVLLILTMIQATMTVTDRARLDLAHTDKHAQNTLVKGNTYS